MKRRTYPPTQWKLYERTDQFHAYDLPLELGQLSVCGHRELTHVDAVDVPKLEDLDLCRSCMRILNYRESRSGHGIALSNEERARVKRMTDAERTKPVIARAGDVVKIVR